MGNNSLQVIETARFKEEAQQLLESDSKNALKALIWALARNPHFGQHVKGSNQLVWVLFRGDYAYLAYYSVAGTTITLESILRRRTPISPGPLGLES